MFKKCNARRIAAFHIKQSAPRDEISCLKIAKGKCLGIAKIFPTGQIGNQGLAQRIGFKSQMFQIMIIFNRNHIKMPGHRQCFATMPAHQCDNAFCHPAAPRHRMAVDHGDIVGVILKIRNFMQNIDDQPCDIGFPGAAGNTAKTGQTVGDFSSTGIRCPSFFRHGHVFAP